MRRTASLLALCLAAGLAACGGGDDGPTPAACLTGTGGFERALAAAPGEVELSDDSPISACLIRNQPVGELTQVGATLVRTATALARGVGTQSDRHAATELGFLVGAVERGAGGTSGIHSELARRVESAARAGLAGAPAPLGRAYQKGYAAGQDHG